MRNAGRITGIIALAATSIALSACTTWDRTTTPRTAIEQMLISTSADRAIDLDPLKLDGKKVFFDCSFIASYDREYVVGNFRDAIAQRATLVEKAEDAQIIVEGRVGALAVNRYEFLLGMPPIPLPIPVGEGTTPIQTPEIPFYKVVRNKGQAKFSLFAVDRETREFVGATGPRYGSSYWNDYIIFFIPFSLNDVFKEPKNAD
jgi:hypothetical protein